jgi:predicted TIM-barrel fold metal-dependent hydrolase
MGDAPRIFLDCSIIPWGYGGPKVLADLLREWLEMGLADKIIYASDAISPILLWISALNMREALNIALKGMIEDGLIDEKQAILIAQMILHDNAKKLYKI